MAFSIDNLSFMSGSLGNLKIWVYNGLSELTYEDIFGINNYFKEAQELYGMQVGDFIFVLAVDVSGWGFLNASNTIIKVSYGGA